MVRPWAACGAVWAVACLGCGDPGPQLEPVSGTVTVGGKPLAAGTVAFRPAAGNPTQHHPVGAIGPEGRYELSTLGKPGAPPGKYKVLVFADANTTPGKAAHPQPPVWLIDKKYTSEPTTDLTAEVVPSPEPGRYDLKLTK